MGVDECIDAVVERECANAHIVDGNPLGAENVESFAHRPVAPAQGDEPDGGTRLIADDRGRNGLGRFLVLAGEPIHHLLVFVGDFGVAAELVVTRAAREKRAFGVDAGQRTRCDRVVVFGRVAEELLHLFEFFAGEHLSAVGLVAVVPLEPRYDPVVHADVEIGEHEDRRLETLGQVERLDCEIKALRRVRREKQDVLGVAVRRVRARQDVALLRARRHAGRRPRTLHVDEHDRDLRVVGEPDELAHQRDARAGGRGERASAVPARADDHADGGELVFGLHDAIEVLAGHGVAPELAAELLERVHHRRGRRDRVPRRDGRARVEAAERRRGVAVDEDRIRYARAASRGGSAAGTGSCRWRSRSRA